MGSRGYVGLALLLVLVTSSPDPLRGGPPSRRLLGREGRLHLLEDAPRRDDWVPFRRCASFHHAHIVVRNPQFERDLILERMMVGLEVAKARGRHGGRPRALDEVKAKLTGRLKDEGEHSVEEICSMLGVGRSTLYRYLGETEGGINRS
jgi:hypothetical protein